MTEKNQKKKKLTSYKRIQRCIGLTVLLCAIAMALMFQAPWKVITLLVIILAASTILPRPVRKWFWLSAGLAVAGLIIWIFLPERGGWTSYKHDFEKEIQTLNDKYAIGDEENAAIIYNELLENSESGDFLPNLNIYESVWSKPWSSEDHRFFSYWLEGQEKTIARLLEASKTEKCLFPIDEESLRTALGSTKRPHLEAMKELALLLVCSANNDLAEKRVEEGLEKQTALLLMSEHLRQQPITDDVLTGLIIQKLALSQINRILITTNPTEPYLIGLEDVITEIEHDWKADWTRITEYEKLNIMKKLLWSLYETNTEGETRITVAEYFRYYQAAGQEKTPYWITRLARVESIIMWLFLPHTPQEAARIIDKTLQKYGSIGNPGSRATLISSVRFNFSYIIRLYVDRYIRSLHDFFMGLKSEKAGARIIIALRRYKNKHGRWPENLDEVRDLAPAEVFIDPINGSSFVYKPTEQNFMLYSKGKNNIDEDGRRSTRRRRRRAGPDDILIWPLRRQ